MKTLRVLSTAVLFASLFAAGCARKKPEAAEVNKGYLDVMTAGAIREAAAVAGEQKGRIVAVFVNWPGAAERVEETWAHFQRHAKSAGFSDVGTVRLPFDETIYNFIPGETFQRVLLENREASVLVWMTILPPSPHGPARPAPGPKVVVVAEVGPERKPEALLLTKKADVLITSKGYSFVEQRGRKPLEMFDEFFEVTK